jgi:AsmA protein
MWRAKKKRSAAGRFFKALGVLVLLCLALLLAVPYLVNLDGFRTRLVRELSQRLGRPVEVSSLRFRTLPRLNLDILGLRILDPPEFGGKAALTAESLRVNVRILPLLRGRLEVQSLGLERPVVVLRRNRSGFNNLFGPRSAGLLPPRRPLPSPRPSPPPCWPVFSSGT